MALEGNEEELEYWLVPCVERKHKLSYPRHDDNEFKYPTSSMVVVSTWIKKIVSRRNGLRAYEDYEANKKIIHYSNLILATNIKLTSYKESPTNRDLWNISMQEHEAIMNTSHEREDLDDIDELKI